MKPLRANRIERWLGAAADGGVSLREERVGRWVYAGVLGLLMLGLVSEPAMPIAARVGLVWYLGLSATLVPLSWILTHVADDRRTLASWGASIAALFGGAVILVGLGQIGIEDESVLTSPLGIWVISLMLFALAQAPIISKWQAFGDHAREALAALSESREPAPITTVTVNVAAPTRPAASRPQPDHDDVAEKQGVS